MTTTTPITGKRSAEIQQYVKRQPRLAWRRHIMRAAIRGPLFRLLCRVTVHGEENVPDTGAGIIMINHISLLDPVLSMGAISNRFVVPMTKVENLRNPFVAPLVYWWGSYPINRGEIDRKALTSSVELLKSGQLILISPEGTRHPEGLAQAKDGLAYIATKADAIIIPTAIVGTDGWLSRILTLQRPRLSVTFGRPFRFKTGESGRVSRDALGAMMEEAMYQLALAIPDPALRGAYSDTTQASTEHLVFVDPRTGLEQV